MKPSAIVILIIVLSLGGGFLFTRIIPPLSGENGGDAAQLRIQVDELSRQVRSLSAAQRDLIESVAGLRAGAGDGLAPASREPVESLAVEVDRWIRKNRPDLVAAGTTDSLAGEDGQFSEEQSFVRAAEMLSMLDKPDLSDEEWSEVWNKINEAGLMDEALALLEGAVEKDPNNPEMHMALAGGYLARTLYTASDLEKGAYAVAADRTLDRALELDPNHWDARFTKASSLTFYPPIMGKQGEALRHFEILLEQQKTMPTDPKHSQTYLFLGNLHQQMGNYQKASQIWKDGLALFPENSELAKQLENAMNK